MRYDGSPSTLSLSPGTLKSLLEEKNTTLVRNVSISPYKPWAADHHFLANALKFMGTHKELRLLEIDLCTWRGCSASSELVCANCICQAFLLNALVPHTSKGIHVKIGLNPELFDEMCWFLQAISEGVTKLKIQWDWYCRENNTWAQNTNRAKLLAKTIASFPKLESLSFQGLGKAADSIFEHITSSASGGCRIREVCHPSPPWPGSEEENCSDDSFSATQLISFLQSDSAACLDLLEIDIGGMYEVQMLTQCLVQNKSITTLKLRADSIDIFESKEKTRALSEYFRDETVVKSLYLHLSRMEYIDRYESKQLEVLLSGLQSNTSVVDFHLCTDDYPWGEDTNEVMRNFFQTCPFHSLSLQIVGDDTFLTLVEGLRHNKSVSTLQYSLHPEDTFEQCNMLRYGLEPLVRLLTLPHQPDSNQVSTSLALETLKIDCGHLGRHLEDMDLSIICDLVRRPIPTLKSIHLKFCVEGEYASHVIASLEAMNQSNHALEYLGLDVASYGEERDLESESLQSFLAKRRTKEHKKVELKPNSGNLKASEVIGKTARDKRKGKDQPGGKGDDKENSHQKKTKQPPPSKRFCPHCQKKGHVTTNSKHCKGNPGHPRHQAWLQEKQI